MGTVELARERYLARERSRERCVHRSPFPLKSFIRLVAESSVDCCVHMCPLGPESVD